MKYALVDTFNNVVLSLHRIERCAEDALQKHDRQVRAANGDTSYIPKDIIWDSDHILRVGWVYETQQLQEVDTHSRMEGKS
jgi:hypothetical protein